VTVKQYRTRAVVSSALATQGDESTTAELSTLALDAANITGLTASVAELNILDGVTATAAEINKVDGLASGAGLVVAQEVTFTETVTAGVWTGSVTVPAGATLLDIIVHAVALWDSETAARRARTWTAGTPRAITSAGATWPPSASSAASSPRSGTPAAPAAPA
jgi:hypothetical protein